MKCSECDNPIPDCRLKAKPNVKTCSGDCSVIRQGSRGNQRTKSYRRRVRKSLGEIEHVPLVDDIETDRPPGPPRRLATATGRGGGNWSRWFGQPRRVKRPIRGARRPMSAPSAPGDSKKPHRPPGYRAGR